MYYNGRKNDYWKTKGYENIMKFPLRKDYSVIPFWDKAENFELAWIKVFSLQKNIIGKIKDIFQ